MPRSIQITLNGQRLKAKPGLTILDLLEAHPHPGPGEALGAIVNNRLMGLYFHLRSDCVVDTFGYSRKEGANIYRRTVTLILYEAFCDICPQAKLEIGQSLGDGYYYTVDTNDGPLTDRLLSRVEKRMREIVAQDRPLRPRPMPSEEAERFFMSNGYHYKAELLRHRQLADVPWLAIGKHQDVAYGPIAPRTSLCKTFSLVPKLPGFVLNFPKPDGKVNKVLPRQDHLFATYIETRQWNELVDVWNVAQLNRACIDGSISDIIKISEGQQEKKIARLADQITSARDRVRLVLIAGPSSSGKTTFTKRLAVQLQVNGIKPVNISIDNYYVDREKTPKNPDGTYDFECLEALDIDLLNYHLERLLKGEEVGTPVYDFVRGVRRSDKTIPLKLGPGQVLIAEGIHALNPQLSRSIALKNKFRIYVSALTQLCIDEHNRIFTSDARLMRRIVRDRLFRGYSAEKSIIQWPHVRAGEEKYIFPFQEEADGMMNTTLIYETAVLRPYLGRFLMEVDRKSPAYIEAYRLFNFLSLFIPIFAHEVPPTSILREFIGGSTFNY